MIAIKLNDLPTRGILSVSAGLRIPEKRVSIVYHEFVVGYYVGSCFRKIYTAESKDNAVMLKDALSKRVGYKVIILHHTEKLTRL